MQIIRVTDDLKDQWDSFVATYARDGGMLQSWGWGDFQKALGRAIFRLGVLDDDGHLKASALLIKHEIHFEYNYLYCPRGPVFNPATLDDLTLLFEKIQKLASEEKSFLVRLDPAWWLGNEKRLLDAGFRKSEREVQPKCSLIVDCNSDFNAFLQAMKPKTRYNIGLAEKKGVSVHISSEIADIETFWQLVKQTAERDQFRPHPKEYYKKMFEGLSPSGTVKLFLAIYDQKVIAANLVSFFGTTATYLHGTSADMYRGVMAPYLLQWSAIKEASYAGYRHYDFGGVNCPGVFQPSWEGLTRFKSGFAPQAAPSEFVGTFEQVINPVVYSLYKFVKQIRG